MFFIYVHCIICIDCGCLSGVINDDDDRLRPIRYTGTLFMISKPDRLWETALPRWAKCWCE